MIATHKRFRVSQQGMVGSGIRWATRIHESTYISAVGTVLLGQKFCFGQIKVAHFSLICWIKLGQHRPLLELALGYRHTLTLTPHHMTRLTRPHGAAGVEGLQLLEVAAYAELVEVALDIDCKPRRFFVAQHASATAGG